MISIEDERKKRILRRSKRKKVRVKNNTCRHTENMISEENERRYPRAKNFVNFRGLTRSIKNLTSKSIATINTKILQQLRAKHPNRTTT